VQALFLNMRKGYTGLIIAVLLATSTPFADAAIIKNGTPCSQVGAKKVISGKTFKCIKSGKKKFWLSTPTASATPTPTASATPTPTASATPTPTASATPTPTASATPTPTASVNPAHFLIASPIDPKALSRVSKFRSCVGHDYSPGFSAKIQNKSIEGLEIARSMKHYLFLKAPFIPSGSIQGFAPFEGTIRIQREQSGNGAQVFVMNESGWTFVFFHGDPLVQNGDKVKAGTPVISWWSKDQSAFASSNGGTVENSSVDIALIDFMANKFESPFLHFPPEILSQWKSSGFDKDSLIITQSARDISPCSVGADGERFSGQAASDQYVVAGS
jgi:biotin carboxyl carrier protein